MNNEARNRAGELPQITVATELRYKIHLRMPIVRVLPKIFSVVAIA
ncbi:MAG: hypothetical protein LBF25_03360 [Puniceicoccales bacterium]|nr:hypothetical protein [Puniceicoccales bacterium]